MCFRCLFTAKLTTNSCGVGVSSLLPRLAAAEAQNAQLRAQIAALLEQTEALIAAQEAVRHTVMAKLYRWYLALESKA